MVCTFVSSGITIKQSRPLFAQNIQKEMTERGTISSQHKRTTKATTQPGSTKTNEEYHGWSHWGNGLIGTLASPPSGDPGHLGLRAGMRATARTRAQAKARQGKGAGKGATGKWRRQRRDRKRVQAKAGQGKGAGKGATGKERRQRRDRERAQAKAR